MPKRDCGEASSLRLTPITGCWLSCVREAAEASPAAASNWQRPTPAKRFGWRAISISPLPRPRWPRRGNAAPEERGAGQRRTSCWRARARRRLRSNNRWRRPRGPGSCAGCWRRSRPPRRSSTGSTPPGASAYDALREAQALAPRDPRGAQRGAADRAADPRLLRTGIAGQPGARRPILPRCLAGAGRARPGPGHGAPAPGTALAGRWQRAAGRAGDAVFAADAARQARSLDPNATDLRDFEARVRAAQGREP